jgi:hypothetical protein
MSDRRLESEGTNDDNLSKLLPYESVIIIPFNDIVRYSSELLKLFEEMSLDPDGYYVPDKLYEDEQVTLYADFTMDFRPCEATPISRPSHIQDIVSGRRRVTMGLPISSAPPLTPVQRLSARRKTNSNSRVTIHRQRMLENRRLRNKRCESEMLASLPKKYCSITQLLD